MHAWGVILRRDVVIPSRASGLVAFLPIFLIISFPFDNAEPRFSFRFFEDLNVPFSREYLTSVQESLAIFQADRHGDVARSDMARLDQLVLIVGTALAHHLQFDAGALQRGPLVADKQLVNGHSEQGSEMGSHDRDPEPVVVVETVGVTNEESNANPSYPNHQKYWRHIRERCLINSDDQTFMAFCISFITHSCNYKITKYLNNRMYD